jgi:hypothetical protein
MAHNHPLSTPFATNPINGDALDDALVERVALAFDDVADIQALDLTGKATSHIIFGTSVYQYDASDTVSAHDGATILVTDDGKRFKNTGTRVNGTANYAVDDRGLTSPPGSPAEGDSYLLPASPSGAWASYARHIAVYINGAWVYIAPRLGMIVYISDETAFAHYDGSAWQDGLGSLQIADGSIKASRLEQAYGWRAESETATPPGSIPGAGVLYIVGTSATGAWSGEDGNVARSTGAAWEFVEAAEGMTIFDKDRGLNVSYKSGTWQPDQASGKLIKRTARQTAGVVSGSTTWVTAIDFGSHAVQAASNKISIRGASIQATVSSTSGFELGLFFDSETTPRQSINYANLDAGPHFGIPFELEYVVPDTSGRVVYLKMRTGGSLGGSFSVASTYAFLEELGAN